jgi:hypothetical protein
LARTAILEALGLYLAWTLATYLLEGRPRTLHRPEAATLRVAYALVANLLVGVVAAAWLARRYVAARLVTADRLGFGLPRRTVIAVLAAVILGLAVHAMRGPTTPDRIAMLNAFSQVLVVSIAEVLVCWVVPGGAFAALLASKGAALRLGLPLLVSALLFGAYHYAHSPPFDTLRMVALLSAVGMATGVFFLASRDVYGTIVFHNALALVGVLGAMDRTGALQSFTRPRASLIAMAAVASITLAGLHYSWLRATNGGPGAVRMGRARGGNR